MRGDDIGVAGWTKNSFIDFPGTVSTVLFFRGCNLRCPYCHNPGIVRGEYPPVPASAIWEFLGRRAGLIEGVVLTGGEPTIHENLLEVTDRIRKLGYRIKLDTNGLQPAIVENCAPDYLALDVKTAPRYYSRVGLTSAAAAQEGLGRTVAMVRSMGEKAEVRITIAPGILDENDIREIGALIDGVAKVFIQPMVKSGELLDPGMLRRHSVSAENVELYRDILSRHAAQCSIRAS